MKRFAVFMVLLSTPALADVISKGGPVADMGGGPPSVAQSNPLTSGKSEPLPPRAPGAIPDSQACSPTGQTLHGELVFPLGCPVAVGSEITQTRNPDGSVSVTVPAGVSQSRNPDGSVSVTYPTGFEGPPTSSGGNSRPK